METTNLEHCEGTPLRGAQDRPVRVGFINKWVFFFCISSWVCGCCLLIGPLGSVIWPLQIVLLVGSDKKELYIAIIFGLDAVIALGTIFVAGIMSDRCTSRWGRRKPFLLVGTITSLVLLVVCVFAENYKSIWIFAMLVMGLNLCLSIAGGPFQGLIPDSVNETQTGAASGVNGFAVEMGNLIGFTLTAGYLHINKYALWLIYTVLGGLFALFSLPTIFGFRERPRADRPPRLTLREFVKAFHLPTSRYSLFFGAISIKFFATMACFTAHPFLAYYIHDVIFQHSAEITKSGYFTAITIVIAVTASIPTSLFAGRASDKVGRKPMVIIGILLMVISNGILLLSTFYSNIKLIFGSGLAYGMGNGIFSTSNWALLVSSLPNKDNSAAKDMGIRAIICGIPEIVAPMISGAIIHHFKSSSFELAYRIVFPLACFWGLVAFILACIFIKPQKYQPQEEINIAQASGDANV